MAERQAISNYSVVEIAKVEMNNHNEINSDQDIDGIMRRFEETLEESMYKAAEGVHI